MPRCQGRPEDDCPDRRNDTTVRSTQGDLFHCAACEEYRFPTKNKLTANKGTTASVSSYVPGKKRDVAAAARNKDSPKDVDAKVKLIQNELLSYVQFYRDSSNADALRRTIHGFYSSEVISETKRCLLSEFQPKLSNCPYIVERRNSTSRLASEAEVEDIVGIFDAADI